MNDVQRFKIAQLYVGKQFFNKAKKRVETVNTVDACTVRTCKDCHLKYWYDGGCLFHLVEPHTLSLHERNLVGLSLKDEICSISGKRCGKKLLSHQLCKVFDTCHYNKYCKGLILFLKEDKVVRNTKIIARCELDCYYEI